jgi:lipid A 3-O-deacylase
MNGFRRLVRTGMAVLALLGPIQAAEGNRSRGMLSIYVENDLLTLSDGGYTSGNKILWISPAFDRAAVKKPVERWVDSLSRRLAPGARTHFVSASLAMSIYTPENILRADPDPADRPYAGVTLAGFGFHSRGPNSLQSIGFQAGVVGPLSGAGSVQRFLHRTFGWTYPKGWARELRNELILGISYDRKWKPLAARPGPGWSWDLVAHAGGGVSNLFTGTNAGVEIRAGWSLPDDFGTSPILTGSDGGGLFEETRRPAAGPGRWGFHAFAAVEAHAVARDLLLDGNTFRLSPRVDKTPLTADLAAGLAFGRGRIKASLAWVYQTRRFRTEELKPWFASLNITWMD